MSTITPTPYTDIDHEHAGMLVLLAALGGKRTVAASACQMLHRLLACPELPPQLVNSATETLLSYQAVPRLCKLLQPELADLPAPGTDA